jgi:hypothetical protein
VTEATSTNVVVSARPAGTSHHVWEPVWIGVALPAVKTWNHVPLLSHDSRNASPLAKQARGTVGWSGVVAMRLARPNVGARLSSGNDACRGVRWSGSVPDVSPTT